MRPPPGYPFVGDIPSRPPPPPDAEARDGSHRTRADREPPGSPGPLGAAFVLAFAGAMMGVGFMLVGVVSAEARRAAQPAREAPQVSFADDESTSEGTASPSRVVDSPMPASPPIERNVPVFPGRFLEGCSASDLETIERVLSGTIGKGAPLYNDGDIVGCAAEYERGARELETALPQACAGPVRALAESRAAAAKLVLPAGRAWALRDAFDGLIEVLDRSKTAGVSL